MAVGPTTLTATNDATPWIGNQNAACDAVFQLLGTWTGTVTFECCTEGNEANPVAMSVTPAAGGAAVTTATANGLWRTLNGSAGGVKARARFTTASSGTVVATTQSADWR